MNEKEFRYKDQKSKIVGRTSTKTLIKALRILAMDIESDDGVANACIAEAAQRLEEFNEGNEK